jgi:hypothetical protein
VLLDLIGDVHGEPEPITATAVSFVKGLAASERSSAAARPKTVQIGDLLDRGAYLVLGLPNACLRACMPSPSAFARRSNAGPLPSAHPGGQSFLTVLVALAMRYRFPEDFFCISGNHGGLRHILGV